MISTRSGWRMGDCRFIIVGKRSRRLLPCITGARGRRQRFAPDFSQSKSCTCENTLVDCRNRLTLSNAVLLAGCAASAVLASSHALPDLAGVAAYGDQVCIDPHGASMSVASAWHVQC